MSAWQDTPLLESVSVPTMLSTEERRYLRWLTATWSRGDGHVLEIGPWLGGSTACLAQGLQDRGSVSDRRIHTVDNFTWRPFMAQRVDLPLAVGDSFQPFFEQYVAPWSDYIVPWRRALPDDEEVLDQLAASIVDDNAEKQPVFTWEPGEPIEILFVDGAKSWTGMTHLLRETAAHLVPDGALLVCQDYKYWGCYWVSVIIELLIEAADHREGVTLALVHDLGANTVSFQLTGGLPEDIVRGLPSSLAALGAERAKALVERAAARLEEHADRHGAAVLGVARTRMLGNLGDWSGAVAAFRAAEARWPVSAPSDNLERAREWLAERGHPVPRSPRYRLGRLSIRLMRLSRHVFRRVCRAGPVRHPESTNQRPRRVDQV